MRNLVRSFKFDIDKEFSIQELLTPFNLNHAVGGGRGGWYSHS